MAENETQAHIVVLAAPGTGEWLADFTTVPFDITEEMRPWSFAQIFDEDGDANEAGTPPPMYLPCHLILLCHRLPICSGRLLSVFLPGVTAVRVKG
jgi:hypothetical protein